MNATIEKIVADALALTPQARAFVVERLIESLDASPGAELSPAWRDEIRKRCREIDEASVELRDVAEVFARAYAALG
jgi:putative addiction module component (TIGR02574 family)